MGTFLYNEAVDRFEWMQVGRHSEIPKEELRVGDWEFHGAFHSYHESYYLPSQGWGEDFELIVGPRLLSLWMAYWEKKNRDGKLLK